MCSRLSFWNKCCAFCVWKPSESSWNGCRLNLDPLLLYGSTSGKIQNTKATQILRNNQEFKYLKWPNIDLPNGKGSPEAVWSFPKFGSECAHRSIWIQVRWLEMTLSLPILLSRLHVPWELMLQNIHQYLVPSWCN